MIKNGGITIALPIISSFIWYTTYFYPHIDALKIQAKKGNAAIASIKTSLYPLAIASEGKRGILNSAIRYSYQSISGVRNESTLARQLNERMWIYATKAHFNDEQIFGIWTNCVLLGCDEGLPQAAKIYYGREITALPYRDQAGLVVLLKAPKAFAAGTARSEKRIKMIMERAKTYNTYEAPVRQ